VLFSAFSPGGSSLIEEKDYIPSITAGNIIIEGGVGAFNQIELQKMLQGKIVRVNPYIGELDEGFSGNASPKDLETMFQLIYLYATSPRMDSTGFLAFKERMKGFLQNRGSRPESVFQDTVQVTLAQYHPRRLPWTVSMLDKFDLQRSFTIYQDRFRDASDFTFVIDGAFQIAEIKPLVLTYLGGLPTSNRKEMWKDVGVNFPKGVVTKTVKKGIEPKSAVHIVFTGPCEWTREHRHAIQSLVSVLNIKLREALREEKGGTYGVGVGATPTQYPRQEYRLAVGWGCSPDRVEELTKTAMDQIDSVKKFGVSDIYITKVKETQRREREVNLKENRFWLNALQSAYYNDEDPLNILRYNELIEMVDSDFIQKAAQKYFDMNNFIRVELFPGDK
ncbi:MAG: insulinase family protein, partial [Ignavibacteriales bacterium]|nr:insulinase family protein [Ignavibacteriales bacterium]